MGKLNPALIAKQAQEAHRRTLALIEGLTPEQLFGERLATVNPLHWEIGHAAYFYEYWVLRHHLKQQSIRPDSDSLYDSITIAHDDRWDLPLPSLIKTLEYMGCVLANVCEALASGVDPERDYLAQYSVFHQDMHNEAYTYTRQTHCYPTPTLDHQATPVKIETRLSGDAYLPAGTVMLGANQSADFVFDNEKWAHPVELDAFHIAKVAVSNGDYLEFVEAGGYQQQKYWDQAGWQWLQQRQLEQPIYWRKQGAQWQQRQFDQYLPLPLNSALIHVSWYEAQAYCVWAKRRLPSEAEWEAAAACELSADGKTLSLSKRHFPWGNKFDPENFDSLKVDSLKVDVGNVEHRKANLDGYALGTVDVNAYAAGDSAFGCRQMLGNVWEWTQDTFNPYPGFVADMYQDYSQPLFATSKVLRGGAWSTRSRMIRNTWRTYYGPERNDVFAGFRTCAIGG